MSSAKPNPKLVQNQRRSAQAQPKNSMYANQWDRAAGESERTPPGDAESSRHIPKRQLPLVVYALVGSGLLYGLYLVERLTERLADYTFQEPHYLNATQWHNREGWVAAFPITVPLL